MQLEERKCLYRTTANGPPSQILSRPATLYRYTGCDQIPMQGLMDVGIPEAN